MLYKTTSNIEETFRYTVRMSGKAVKSTLPAIVSTLEKIVDSDHDSRSMSGANGLLRKVCSFEFILSLTVLLDILSYTKSLSDYLQ